MKLTLSDNPSPCPGSYDLHLYCKYDNPDHGLSEFPHQYGDFQTYGEAAYAARKAGWILHRDGYGTCPKCAAVLAGRAALAEEKR